MRRQMVVPTHHRDGCDGTDIYECPKCITIDRLVHPLLMTPADLAETISVAPRRRRLRLVRTTTGEAVASRPSVA